MINRPSRVAVRLVTAAGAGIMRADRIESVSITVIVSVAAVRWWPSGSQASTADPALPSTVISCVTVPG